MEAAQTWFQVTWILDFGHLEYLNLHSNSLSCNFTPAKKLLDSLSENTLSRTPAAQQEFTISLGTNESRLHLDQAHKGHTKPS